MFSLKPYTEHPAVHCTQNYDWDCGVSCVLMLLNEDQRQYFLKHFSEIVEEEGFGQSTWTIDLCYLLQRYNITHRMYTKVMGVNENNLRHGYYDKVIELDRERVTRRFKEASNYGLAIEQRSLRVQELVAHLVHEGPAVVLVDGNLLLCDMCKYNKVKAGFRSCFGGSYKGHYILVVGFSAGGSKLLYRDPALSARLCVTTRRNFLRAHLANGTDDDVILIYKKK